MYFHIFVFVLYVQPVVIFYIFKFVMSVQEQPKIETIIGFWLDMILLSR